jgi:putative SOS response-associated peptidase YedK
MCGRYTFSSIDQALIDRFDLEELPGELQPRYNIGPGQPAAVIRKPAAEDDVPTPKRSLNLGIWGFQAPWGRTSKLLINSRVESIEEKPAFRESYAGRRCIVPADGWYEWEKRGKTSQPWFIHSQSTGSLALAGIWSPASNSGQADSDLMIEDFRFCIITSEADSRISFIHPRMPLILPAESWESWLTAGRFDLSELSRTERLPELDCHPVSRRVNSIKSDDNSLLEEVQDDYGFQGELF